MKALPFCVCFARNRMGWQVSIKDRIAPDKSEFGAKKQRLSNLGDHFRLTAGTVLRITSVEEWFHLEVCFAAAGERRQQPAQRDKHESSVRFLSNAVTTVYGLFYTREKLFLKCEN